MNNDENIRTYLKEFYTLAQLSDELNINIQTLRIYVKKGCDGVRLNAYKVGNTYYTTRDDVRVFLEQFKTNE